MTPRTLSNKLEGLKQKEVQELAINRHFTTCIVNAFGAKAKPRDILKIDEIDTKEVEIASKEQIEKELQMWERLSKLPQKKFK